MNPCTLKSRALCKIDHARENIWIVFIASRLWPPLRLAELSSGRVVVLPVETNGGTP
jgi:hypothetical protein